MTKESWKQIRGYKNYEVSNFGNVRTKTRQKFWTNHGTQGYYTFKGKLLKLVPRRMTKNLTYMQVNLWSSPTQQSSIHVHRLVAKAFIKQSSNRQQVNHIDGDGTNNLVSNLEWVTRSENSLHAYHVLGRVPSNKGKFGVESTSCKKVIQKNIDGGFVKKWDCASDAVRTMGFDSGSISRCCSGKSRFHRGYKWEYA